MKRINHLALHQLVSRIYGALGLSEDKAALLSDSLVMADLWGHASHGTLRTTWYAERSNLTNSLQIQPVELRQKTKNDAIPRDCA